MTRATGRIGSCILAAVCAGFIGRGTAMAETPKDLTVYVAPNGNDAASGATPRAEGTDGPLATLAAARDATRRAEPGTARRIVLAGGPYFLNEPLVLDARDSGMAIEAAPGATAVLYGGRRVTGWQKDGDRFYAAAVPEVADGRWDFRMLAVNGRYCPRARVPQDGHFTHRSEFNVPWMSTTGGGWKRKPTQEELTTLRYRAKDLEPWLNARNAELTVYHMWDESLAGVAAIDTTTHTLTFTNPLGHPPGAFGVKRYVVWNVREGMHEPGQWYLDRAAGKVVYWPLDGQDMAAAESIAPTTECIIRIAGTKAAPVRDVTLRRLTLSVTNTPLKAGGFGAYSYDGAVSVAGAENCRLDRLTVTCVGGYGIKAHGAPGLRVEACEVHHTGAGGIYASADGAMIADNLVHDVGLSYPSGIGITGGGNAGRVVHNTIHDTSYSAITYSGTDVVIEANHIWRAMRVLHDGAGIYTFAPKRLVMRGNFIHDIADTGGYGASAYYLDERAEGCTVEGNLALRVRTPSHNHMARGNTIRGNVFITDGPMRLTFPRSSGFTFEKNVLVSGGGITFTNPAGITTFKDNVLFSRTGEVLGQPLKDYSPETPAALAREGAALRGDPKLLAGWEKGIVRFGADSPALGLGIQPIDVSRAGRRAR